MIRSADLELFRTLTGRARRTVLSTHINPDGDAIGSEVGVAHYLRAMGAQTRVVNHDETPDVLKFIESDQVKVELYEPERHDAAFAEADLVVLLDNSAPDRLGRMEKVVMASASRLLCIDHHPTKGTPWAHNIIEEGSSATAAMVYELVTRCGWTPDLRTAEALYVGLSTDTGVFRFNSTTPRAHEIAAELMRLGVQPARCFQEIYERNSLAFTRLLGHALAGLEVHDNGRVAAVRITRAMVDACEADGIDTSEMTTSLLAMDGVQLALLFRELSDGRVKVSLRSKGELDVHHLASTFGGGGHRNASGIVMKGDIEDVSRQIVGAATGAA